MSRDQYRSFQATELFCPHCQRPTEVRERLLLVLPTGRQYEYRCTECGNSVGSKSDNDAREFQSTLSSRLEESREE